MAETLIGTIAFPSSDIKDFYAVCIDKNTTLMTDAVTGLYSWNNSTDTIVRVIDYLPTQLTSSGGATGQQTVAWCQSNTPSPYGHFLTYHKGRVFVFVPDKSTAYYSGTRVDLDASGNTIRPWELWNVRMDLSRHNPGHGGSMILGDVNQRITGAWPTEEGLLIFKENSIYLWTWPDSAAPHEVGMGASLDLLHGGLGLISYYSICQNGANIYFYGRDQSGAPGVYRYSSGQLECISDAISSDLRNLPVTDYSQKLPQAGIVDGYYVLAPQIEYYDEGTHTWETTLAPSFVYDLELGCWMRMSGVYVSALHTSISSGKIFVSELTDGLVYGWPNKGYYEDFGTTGIDWSVTVPSVDDEDAVSEKKFRVAYVNGDTLGGDDGLTVQPGVDTDIAVLVQYTDNHDDFTTSFVGRDTAVVPLSHRAQEAMMTVYGASDHSLRLRDMSIGWRQRRQVNG